MPESTQHKLDRVRRPRVQITYDVETLGSIVKTELPFVVGIMADLSGNSLPNAVPNADQPTLKDRKFVEIDRDNFDTIMEKIDPKVKVGADTLHFKTLDDFSPINVLRNVPELKKLFDSRTRLSNLVAKLDGNVKLQEDFVASYNQLDESAKNALRTYIDALNPLAHPAARTPQVTNAIGEKDRISKSAVIIRRNEADSAEVTHFKITGITGGELFKTTDAAATSKINNDDFITVAEGEAGLWFKRDNVATSGSFQVQASTAAADTGLGGDTVKASIVNLRVPTVTPAVPAKVKKGEVNTGGLVITPAGDEAAAVTHFKITGITNGELFKDRDAKFRLNEGDFITAAEGANGLTFKPAGDTGGKFKVQASVSGTDNGLVGDIATAKIEGGK